jgi:hypothetical protein
VWDNYAEHRLIGEEDWDDEDGDGEEWDDEKLRELEKKKVEKVEEEYRYRQSVCCRVWKDFCTAAFFSLALLFFFLLCCHFVRLFGCLLGWGWGWVGCVCVDVHECVCVCNVYARVYVCVCCGSVASGVCSVGVCGLLW